MVDPNLIACIYPYDSLLYAVETINMRENQSRRIVCPETESQNLNMYGGYYALELRFNEAPGPSKGQGFVFGTNPDSDIVLPRSKCLKGVWSTRCAISFEDRDRLTLKDLGKGDGIAVVYPGRVENPELGILRDILPDSSASASAGASAGGKYPLVVMLHRDLKFYIMVSDHDVDSALHKGNVSRFCMAPL
ncbi:hypothetical protein B0T24DRAFT_353504 [Lasiosphaeria ovina]|uniref:Uncharacterized protein n=1 Tax=Lasiosphaeria ovina TaxID=92902 RepID=A0AAE0K3U9_9PEZI|nr:hypothetical protein B0T24DRAFT_353504 [Lasiosphaeria ovina]